MEKKQSHPVICPKCKYNRPLGLSYCPHCREQDKGNENIEGKKTNKDLQTLVDNIQEKGRSQLKKKVNQGSLKSKKSTPSNTKQGKNTTKHTKTTAKRKLKRK